MQLVAVIDTVIFCRRILFGMNMHTNPQLLELQISQKFVGFYLAILMMILSSITEFLSLSSRALIFVNVFVCFFPE
jgi:hypothetical protein